MGIFELDNQEKIVITASMFGDFIKRLTAPASAPLTDNDARLALGALLVRVAKADDCFDAQEAALIHQLLSSRYSLTDDETAELFERCQVLESEAPDTVRFTRAIKDAVNHEDRIGVIEDLWAVVLSDGVRDATENSIMRLVVGLLGINDMESAKARHRVQDSL